MHFAISILYFMIKKSQLTPNESYKRRLTTQVTLSWVLWPNYKGPRVDFRFKWKHTPTTYSLPFKVRRVLKGNQSDWFQFVHFKSESAKMGRMWGQNLLGGGKKSGSRLLLQSKTLFRDPLFHLPSCESQITSMHFSFLNYKMRKWTRWPGKVFLVLISMVLWEYRNFRKNLKHELF